MRAPAARWVLGMLQSASALSRSEGVSPHTFSACSHAFAPSSGHVYATNYTINPRLQVVLQYTTVAPRPNDIGGGPCYGRRCDVHQGVRDQAAMSRSASPCPWALNSLFAPHAATVSTMQGCQGAIAIDPFRNQQKQIRTAFQLHIPEAVPEQPFPSRVLSGSLALRGPVTSGIDPAPSCRPRGPHLPVLLTDTPRL